MPTRSPGSTPLGLEHARDARAALVERGVRDDDVVQLQRGTVPALLRTAGHDLGEIGAHGASLTRAAAAQSRSAARTGRLGQITPPADEPLMTVVPVSRRRRPLTGGVDPFVGRTWSVLTFAIDAAMLALATGVALSLEPRGTPPPGTWLLRRRAPGRDPRALRGARGLRAPGRPLVRPRPRARDPDRPRRRGVRRPRFRGPPVPRPPDHGDDRRGGGPRRAVRRPGPLRPAAPAPPRPQGRALGPTRR